MSIERTEAVPSGRPNARLAVSALVWLISLVLMTAPVEAVSLVKDGVATATIYVTGPVAEEAPKNSAPWAGRATPEQLRRIALQELAYHIKKMSGATPDVVVTDDVSTVVAPAIVLGEMAVKLGAIPTRTSPSKEGFRVLTRDGRVLVGGESDHAVLHGVYQLLRALGCDWVMPGEIGESIPRRKTVVVGDLDIAAAPSFPSRRLWYRGYPDRKPEHFERFYEWSRRMRGRVWSDMVGYPGGHVWNKFISKLHPEEFENDPTMLALRRNSQGEMVRTGPQLESTHPRVVQLFVQDIKDTYEKNIEAGKWTRETKAGFGIGPADGLGYSESAESKLAGAGRMDPIIGELDRTDELVLLGNRILEKVLPDYPNAYVGFYSYSLHADYPARYRPHPHIVPIFAPINFSRYHSLLDGTSKTRAYYRDVIEQWSRLAREQGNPLYYRGYSWNLADNMLPYTKVRIWGEALPFYARNGFVALNVEGTKMWSVLGPSDYVFMRLAWDSSQDWREVLRDYCEAAYGPGADAMERYNLRLIERQHAAGMEAGSYHAMHLIHDRQFITEARGYFKQALDAAQDARHKARIRVAAIPIDMLELYLNYHDATMQHDFVAAKTWYDAMHAHWQKHFDANNDLVANEAPAYLKRFLARFVDEGLKYSTEPYRLLVTLPDEVKTMFDPHGVGHRMGFQSPHINDDDFITTRTFSTTWDAQGLAGLRTTAVWYRYRFTLPDMDTPQPIGLFVGGVEDEARVWVNGELIGTSGRGFSQPFVFDLTDGMDYDGENLLAVQVIRNSKANEIGLGGIIRPGFIFAGPRLEKKAPTQINLGRVLPGGEIANE